MLFIAATADNSYVELSDDAVRLRFGAWFDRSFRRDLVTDAQQRAWPIINGLGIRAGGEVYGVVGSTEGVVELQLSERVPLPFWGFPWSARRIALSLEDPDAFIAALALEPR